MLNAMQSLDRAILESRWTDAVSVVQSIEPRVERPLARAEQWAERLSGAQSQLRNDAKNQLSKAEKAVSPNDSAAVDGLNQSKSAFRNEQYAKSLLYSHQALKISSQSPLSGLSTLSVPMAVVPLIALVALGLWWKRKKAAPSAEEKVWKKIPRFEKPES